MVTIACGRIQVSYAGGIGLFDHLNEAIILDLRDDSKMRLIFEALIDEYQKSGPASAAMMKALTGRSTASRRPARAVTPGVDMKSASGRSLSGTTSERSCSAKRLLPG